MLIDTHCHLIFKAFKGNVNELIKKAEKTGVKTIIVPSSHLKNSQKAVNLAQKHKNVYAAVGVHPVHADKVYKVPIKKLEIQLTKLAHNKKVVAIGETGLDYFQIDGLIEKKLKIKKQKQIFKMQIKLAGKLKLPLIIHNRSASNDILTILKSPSSKFLAQNSSFVFHCYEGQPAIWQYVKKHPQGFIGITANITYNKLLQQVVQNIPLSKIVIETDSPFILPKIPGQSFSFPNRPANVKIVAEFIATLKGLDFKLVAKQTSKNAKKLFAIS